MARAAARAAIGAKALPKYAPKSFSIWGAQIKKAKSVEAAMASIADEYERMDEKKMATYVRSGEGKYATFLLYPSMSSTTAKAEQVAKWLKAWLRNSEKTVTAKGRRRKSDACTAGGTAIRRGGSVYDMLCEDLGVLPPAEYAQIRAEGQRRPRHGTTASGARARRRRGRGVARRGAAPAALFRQPHHARREPPAPPACRRPRARGRPESQKVRPGPPTARGPRIPIAAA